MAPDSIKLQNYLVIETSDLENANTDGSITVPSGEEVALVEYEPQSTEAEVLLHALGAANAADVRFRLRYGQNISNTMESPPGGLNDAFSFTNELGSPLTSEKTVQYTAINESGSDIDLAARVHLEVVPKDGSDLTAAQRGI